MKERPILMSAPMVRALLAGTKTQTRRAVKPQPDEKAGDYRVGDVLCPALPPHKPIHCPYGLPGDRLWVREAWGYFDPDGSGEDYDRDLNDDGKSGPCHAYRAEMMQEGHALRDYWRRRIAYKATFAEQKYGMGPVGPNRWRPSIHMPRWASRITLEITGVRVERLQAISEADAGAEGIVPYTNHPGRWLSEHRPGLNFPSAVAAYRDLWESINGAGSWDANPSVWCVSFRRAV